MTPVPRRHGVHRTIESILRISGDVLPSVQDLCAQVGVSRGTVLRAIGELKRIGRLQRRGKTLHLTSSSTGPSAEPPPSLSLPRDRVLAAIERDLLNGHYLPGAPVPIVKELQARYGASYRSIKRSLGSLLAAGKLEAHGRGYAAPRLLAARATATVVLVARSDHTGHINLGMHDAEWLSALRLECARDRLTLDTVTFTPGEPVPILRRPGSPKPVALPAGRPVLGYLYLMHSSTCFQPAILDAMRRTGSPVAILDEYGVDELPAIAQRSPAMRVFRMTVSTIPGRQMAQFILHLGHRRVAFISPTHQMTWAQRRYEGFVQAFRSAGLDGGVVPVLMHRVFNRTDTTDPGIAGIHERLRELTLSSPVHLRGETASIEDAAEVGPLRRAEVRGTLRPVLESILRDAGVTAIASVNDSTGVLALEFCRERQVPVPGRLSIVSFDDTNESLECNLTSYNFNIAGTALAMVRSVVDPRSVEKTGPVIEMEGTVVARRSSGAAGEG